MLYLENIFKNIPLKLYLNYKKNINRLNFQNNYNIILMKLFFDHPFFAG
jgi:hypothetical protein